MKETGIHFIPKHEELCISREAAEHVYQSILHDKAVNPLYWDSGNTLKSEAASLAYGRALMDPINQGFECDQHDQAAGTDLTWSILSNEVSYCVHDTVSPYMAVNKSKMYDKFLGDSPILGQPEANHDLQLDKFSEVYCSVRESTQFDNRIDVSTTYMGSYFDHDGRTFQLENVIPYDSRGVTKGLITSGETINVFFDSGATHSYLSWKYYKDHKSLHDLPKLSSEWKGIKVGNGQICCALFFIPLQVLIQGHAFEIYTFVAEIDDAMDLIIGMQSQTELEGIMNSRVSGFEFLSQSIPIFPDNDMKVPIGGIQMVKFHCPFPEVLSGQAICKFFAGPSNHTLKLRIENNKGVVKFENNGPSETKFNTFTFIGI